MCRSQPDLEGWLIGWLPINYRVPKHELVCIVTVHWCPVNYSVTEWLKCSFVLLGDFVDWELGVQEEWFVMSESSEPSAGTWGLRWFTSCLLQLSAGLCCCDWDFTWVSHPLPFHIWWLVPRVSVGRLWQNPSDDCSPSPRVAQHRFHGILGERDKEF